MEKLPEEGTIRHPRHYEGLADSSGGSQQHRRYFAYRTDAGLVTGTATSVMFTLDQPTKDVWPYFKDFNLWQNSHDHYYSGVLGDLEGKTYRLGTRPNEPGPYSRTVLKVIPEHLIVTAQACVEEGGFGGYSVFMLSEYDGKTIVSILMQHDRLTRELPEEEALDFWRKMAPELLRKWRDIFIPNLRRLVSGNS